MSHIDTTEVEEGAAKDDRPAAPTALDVPYPISAEEIQDGWNTLLCKCWLQCADCSRWRNVPEAVRDEVRGASLHASCASSWWLAMQVVSVAARILRGTRQF